MLAASPRNSWFDSIERYSGEQRTFQDSLHIDDHGRMKFTDTYVRSNTVPAGKPVLEVTRFVAVSLFWRFGE